MNKTQATTVSQSSSTQQPVDRVTEASAHTQAEKFEAAARELGCDLDEDRLKGVLRKLAKPKASDNQVVLRRRS